MNIRKKSPAELEHQVADYLLRTDHPGMMRAWYLSEIATLLLATEPDELIHNASFREMNPLVQDDDIEVFVDNYTLHLSGRSNMPDGEQDIYTQKTKAVERYEREFKHLVAAIDRTADTGMMSGYHSTPYIIEKNGKEYVVRVIDPRTSLHEVEKHINGSLRVHDIDHLEHVEAVSYAEGITVSPRLPGKSFKQLEQTGDAQSVTREQIHELYTALKEANSRGVGFDGIGGNFLYDPETGFHVVDFEPLSSEATASTAFTRQLSHLANCADANLDYLHELSRIIEAAAPLIIDDPDAGENAKKIQQVLDDLRERTEFLEDYHNPRDDFGFSLEDERDYI